MVMVSRSKIYGIVLVIIFLLFSIPFFSQYLFNWDAGQFALGVASYNIEQHQPHPPGYPIFIFFGWVLNLIFSNVNFSLCLISMLFGLLAVIFLYLLIQELFPKDFRLALIVALFFIFNPIFWFYREIALTYTVDAFMGIFLLWILLKGKQNNYFIFLGSLVLGLSGGFRPTLIMLLMPLYLLNLTTLYEKKAKKIFLNIFILLAAILIWFLPMVHLAGGFAVYYKITQNLLSASAAETSILSQAPYAATITQINTFFSILFVAINVLIIPLLYSLYFFWKEKKYQNLKKNLLFWSIIFWLLPAGIIYTVIHFGQPGYILIILPIFVILSAWGMAYLKKSILGRIILILLLIVEASIFLLFNNRVNNPVTLAQTSAIERKLCRLNPWIFKFNYYMIRTSDSKWQKLISDLQAEGQNDSLIIAVRDLMYTAPNGLSVRNDENFRQVTFYLPQIARSVVEVAPNRDFYIIGEYSGDGVEYKYHTLTKFAKNIKINKPIKQVVILAQSLDEKDLPIGLILQKKDNYYFANLVNQDKFEFLGFKFSK